MLVCSFAQVFRDQAAKESSPLLRMFVCSISALLVPQDRLMPSAYRSRKRELRMVSQMSE